MKVLDRFLKYISFDTTSNEKSKSYPSTSSQLEFAQILQNELTELGVFSTIENGYVIATIPSNTNDEGPTIAFIAHMDTSNAVSGKNIQPQIVRNYQGDDIILNPKIIMHVKDFPILNNYIGHDLLTTNGKTLLGADDKAGIACIMEMVSLIDTIPHGKIKIAFTPDEEIGRGVEHFDVKKFDADWAFTIDGGCLGDLNFENFNAASAKIIFYGQNIHPGSAKGKMINALHLAYLFHKGLPTDMVPEKTEGYEGFNHLTSLNGNVNKATASYIIRNHQLEEFNQQKVAFQQIADKIKKTYGSDSIKLTIKDSYYNMGNIINNQSDIIKIALKAMENLDIKPQITPIRGGTDGALLTYKGLICPNLGTSGENFHSIYEFLSINHLEKNVFLLLEIAKLAHFN